MNRPWMPLYVADYRADTAHLNAAQHGAYLLLIMHYWQTGGLPTDDAPLARIACMTISEWRKSRPVIASFFTSGWRHKRIDAEIARAADISSKRRASAEQRHSKRNANAQQLDTHTRASSQSQSQYSEPNGSAAAAAPEPVGEDPKAKLFRVGKTALVSWGIAEKRTGALIGQWLKTRNDPIGLLAAIQYARDQNVADPVAYVSSLVHAKDSRNGPTNRSPPNGGDLARELAAEVRERELEAGLFRPADAVGGH